MVRISCDVCGTVKSAADGEWILGYDLQVKTKAGLRRSVQFLDHWYDYRALEFGTIHLCSKTCMNKYLEASRVA
jgi:putative heme degradation protein